jgi:hypothetical protein
VENATIWARRLRKNGSVQTTSAPARLTGNVETIGASPLET